ncbi:hypothetical protein ASD67_17405 [Sphingopyxis sp. Root1497]|uniref:DUF2855 family protein n=1 Tax=Sphingopyxis sp. Root1497 TaxID=1736474 RepID=UPI0006F50723|nr:DUF2855 family protein [Sphingopyxis sp. Root1497]KQZ61055.1 hypothetical protein ASD67_17405 [Sphingopyxis sp. Root1497]
MRMLALEVSRSALDEAVIVSEEAPDLAPGQVLMAVEQLALTANTITYADVGETFGYWDFFPATLGTRGRIPAWGFMRVAASTLPDLPVGRRFYGYVPIATHFVAEPKQIGTEGFVDASPHRTHFSLFYNYYSQCRMSAGGDNQEPLQALLQPLFMTGFLLEDYIDEKEAWGGSQLILSSASSKTALAVALRAKARASLKVVGLTSPANLAFAASSGAYDQLLTYGQAGALDLEPAVLVDMAGDPALVARIHRHLNTKLKQSIAVGGTHRAGGSSSGAGFEGVQPSFFFAPAQSEKRSADWGPGEVERRFAAAWAEDVAMAEKWLRVVRHDGPDAVLAIYRHMLTGKADPADGHILSLAASSVS